MIFSWELQTRFQNLCSYAHDNDGQQHRPEQRSRQRSPLSEEAREPQPSWQSIVYYPSPQKWNIRRQQQRFWLRRFFFLRRAENLCHRSFVVFVRFWSQPTREWQCKCKSCFKIDINIYIKAIGTSHLEWAVLHVIFWEFLDVKACFVHLKPDGLQ